MLQDVVRLADQLHVAVLDAVVHHLNVVPGTGFADPVAARNVVILADLRADFLKDVFDERPRFGMTTRHDAGAFESPFLAAGNSSPDKAKAFGGQLFVTPVGVVKVGVATIDDDVAFGEQWLQRVDDRVRSPTSLDHDHDAPRRCQTVDEILELLITVNPVRGPFLDDAFWTIAEAVDELRHLLGRAVVNGNVEPFVGHIHDQVLTHHSKADQADIVVGHFECSL